MDFKSPKFYILIYFTNKMMKRILKKKIREIFEIIKEKLSMWKINEKHDEKLNVPLY